MILPTINVLVEFMFSAALLMNALLFIPQAVKIFKEKTAQDLSMVTFLGFLFIQLVIIWHGFLQQDYALVWGYLASMITCGSVVILILIYKNHPLSTLKKDQLELLDNVLALMPGHVYWVDKCGIYLGCNDQQARSAGLSSRKEIIGKRNQDLPWNINSSVLPAALDQVNQEVMRTRKRITIEEPALLADGSEAIFLSTKVPLSNSKGQIIGMTGISIDITERKKNEHALKEAKEAAELAQHAKSQFLYNMRHDLRTPFSGLLSMAEILETQETDPTKKSYLTVISECARTLLNHLNDILDYIHSEDATMPLTEKGFDIHQLLASLAVMMAPAVKIKNLTFDCHCDSNIPQYLRGDCFRTQRILIHLVANAIKFTSAGHVSVKASVFKKKKTSLIVQFIIKDTGIGIPSDKHDLIFQQFTRLTPSYQGQYLGKGLGLSVVKRFLDELQGEAHLESTVGKGSIFQILIPYKCFNR